MDAVRSAHHANILDLLGKGGEREDDVALEELRVQLGRRRHTPDRVDVFFCGPPALGRKVELAATKAGCPFRQEHF